MIRFTIDKENGHYHFLAPSRVISIRATTEHGFQSIVFHDGGKCLVQEKPRDIMRMLTAWDRREYYQGQDSIFVFIEPVSGKIAFKPFSPDAE